MNPLSHRQETHRQVSKNAADAIMSWSFLDLCEVPTLATLRGLNFKK